MSLLKTRFEEFAVTIAEHLNFLYNNMNDNVSTETYNNAIKNINDEITNFREKITAVVEKVDAIDGIKFTADTATNTLYLKNRSEQVLTSIDVGFLNNEGTKFVYNEGTKSIDLKNDGEELLSSIPLSSFVSGLPINIGFNTETPYKLELKTNEGVVVSSIDIDKNNIKGLSDILNSIKTIYNNDGTINGVRTINFTDTLKFVKGNKEVKFDSGEIDLSKLTTSNFTVSTNTTLLEASNLDNTNNLNVGNTDIDKVSITGKQITIPNMPVAHNHGRTVCIDENGNLAYTNGTIQNLVAGDGLIIENNVIKLAPQDKISLVFNW